MSLGRQQRVQPSNASSYSSLVDGEVSAPSHVEEEEDDVSEVSDEGGDAMPLSQHNNSSTGSMMDPATMEERTMQKRRTGFIQTLYEMANTPENASGIGFAADGVSLEIRNTDDLSAIVLPKHFKHRNVSSFIRQLNNYGFRTIPSTKGVFQTFVHDHFLKGRHDLITNIVRRTGREVKKKKTLYEQVCEFKQKESERKRRMEEIEANEQQRKQLVRDLEAQNKMLGEERDALLMENQRLLTMLSATALSPSPQGHHRGNHHHPNAGTNVLGTSRISSDFGSYSHPNRHVHHHQQHHHHPQGGMFAPGPSHPHSQQGPVSSASSQPRMGSRGSNRSDRQSGSDGTTRNRLSEHSASLSFQHAYSGGPHHPNSNYQHQYYGGQHPPPNPVEYQQQQATPWMQPPAGYEGNNNNGHINSSSPVGQSTSAAHTPTSAYGLQQGDPTDWFRFS